MSADKSAGHASGFDLVLVDETGLLLERDRELIAGLRSSISARNGRLIHISIRGASPLYREILSNPATVARTWEAPPDCRLDDRDAWAAANPGLGSIKSVEYMAAEVERLKAAPSDEASFRAFDLNQALEPSREMICSPADLQRCYGKPDFSGPVVLGVRLWWCGVRDRRRRYLAGNWSRPDVVCVRRYAAAGGALTAR